MILHLQIWKTSLLRSLDFRPQMLRMKFRKPKNILHYWQCLNGLPRAIHSWGEKSHCMGLLPPPSCKGIIDWKREAGEQSIWNHGHNPTLVALVEELFACCKVGVPESMPVCQVLIPCYVIPHYSVLPVLLNLHWLQYKTWELLLPYGCYLSNLHILDWNLLVSIFLICLYSVDQVAVALTHMTPCSEFFLIVKFSTNEDYWGFFQILWGNSRYQWWLELLMLIF